MQKKKKIVIIISSSGSDGENIGAFCHLWAVQLEDNEYKWKMDIFSVSVI